MDIDTINNRLSSIDDESIVIQMHRTPDPDSIGAAKGLQWLLSTIYNKSSKIVYSGEISHPQNKTLVNLLDVTMTMEDASSYDLGIIVDATTANVNVLAKGIILVIDHHPVDNVSGAINIIEPVGSACTLVWEIIKSISSYSNIKEADLDTAEFIDPSVATALFIGIRNDTANLISERCTARDWVAAQELAPYIDKKKLSSIESYPYPRYFFELEKSINHDSNWKQRDSTFVGTVGIITAAKRDCLPVLADKMIRLEGVETSVIFAVVGDCLEACIRSQNNSIDVSDFAKRIFGAEYSGGKMGMGASRVPLGIASPSSGPEEACGAIWGGIKEKLFNKIFDVAGGNQ